MSRKIKLDGETVDRIVVLSLKEQRKYLKKEIKNHLTKGTYMHHDDLTGSRKMVDALNTIIHFYGG